MIGENLTARGDEKAGAEYVEMHLRSGAGEAEHGTVALVSKRIAGRGETGVVERQSTIVIAKGKHHMDEADARLIGLNNVLREAAAALELLYASLYLAQLLFQRGSACVIAVGNLCFQRGALLLQLGFLWIAGCYGTAGHLITRAADVFE